jgi:hypothetical protein
VGSHFGPGGDDEGDVWVLRLPERSGHADDHDVGALERGGVCRRLVPSLLDKLNQIFVQQVRRAGLARLESAYPVEVGVDPDHVEPDSSELYRQRQPHVSLPDDRNARGVLGNARGQT